MTTFVGSMITMTLPSRCIVAEGIHGDMHALNADVDLVCSRKAFHPDGLPEEVVAAVIRRE